MSNDRICRIAPFLSCYNWGWIQTEDAHFHEETQTEHLTEQPISQIYILIVL